MLGFDPHHHLRRRRYVNVDIFPCQNSAVEDARAASREALALRRLDWQLLDRGRRFPKHIGPARAVVARDRRLVAREAGLEASS